MYDLGTRIKETREKRGLTQRELAPIINKSSATVSSYETNIQTPPTDVLISIAQALRVSVTYLLDMDSEDCLCTANLTNEQKDFLDQLFREFTSPTERLSSQQIMLIRQLILLFEE